MVFVSTSVLLVLRLFQDLQMTTQRIYTKDVNNDDELVSDFLVRVGKYALEKLVFLDASKFNDRCVSRYAKACAVVV